MSKPYPDLRTVGLTVGYVNKASDDNDHPHKHLGQAMLGCDGTSDGRVLIFTKNNDGSIAITDFRKHEDQCLQDFTVEHLTNVGDDLWDRINQQVTTAVHPGQHGYADDSNFMIQDFNIVRLHEEMKRKQDNALMSNVITPAQENFLVQSNLTNLDTKPSEVRELITAELENHFDAAPVNSRVLIVSEMEDGAVQISHINATRNHTQVEVNNFAFTSGKAMYDRMAAGFDNAIESIGVGQIEQG